MGTVTGLDVLGKETNMFTVPGFKSRIAQPVSPDTSDKILHQLQGPSAGTLDVPHRPRNVCQLRVCCVLGGKRLYDCVRACVRVCTDVRTFKTGRQNGCRIAVLSSNFLF